MLRTLLLTILLGGCFIEPSRPGPGQQQPPGQAQLAVGFHFACAIRDGGALACWGQDADGQLGVLPPHDRMPTPQTALGSGWTAIAAGNTFACGLAGATLKCWGTFAGRTQSAPTEIVLPAGAQPAKVFASDLAMCAIDTTGEVYCLGMLAGVEYDSPTKLAIAGLPGRWTSVALAYEHACALDSSGTAYCWGDAGYFLGSNDQVTPHTVDNAQQVAGFTFESISADQGATCGVTTDHELVCGGAAVYRIGDSGGGDGPPAVIDSRTTWKQVSIGNAFACGIVDGHVECYGYNDAGVLGDGFGGRDSFGNSVYDNATGVAASSDFVCATDGTEIRCWGSNAYGEMGNGKVAITFAPGDPVPLPAGTCTNIVANDDHTCVLVDGLPYCWGNNNYGQSVPAGSPVTTPAKAASVQLTSLAVGDLHACGVTTNGASLHCWGVGDPAQLISAGTKDIPAPAGTTWVSVSASDVTTCATASDGKVYCVGELPWKTSFFSTATVTASPLTGNATAAGTGNVAGITRGMDSIMYAGTLCDHAVATAAQTVTAPSAMLTQIKSSIDTTQFGDPSGHICALDEAAGSLWCFGENGSEQVTSSQNDCEPAPVQVSLTNVTAFSVNGRHSCAVAGGALSCWGQNEVGELGAANIGASFTAPQQIDGMTWTDVGAGAQHVCAINQDGHVYCWGLNVFGEVGVGEHFHPTPTAVQF